MMYLRTRLTKLAAAVAEQAVRDPDFAAKLEDIMGAGRVGTPLGPRARPARAEGARKGGRRAAAMLDPVDLVRAGPDRLREALGPLELAQLLDIVAEYGMDPGKLVMKWKDRDRIIDRVVETATARATKGDAFRQREGE